jgi:hypothetical protein
VVPQRPRRRRQPRAVARDLRGRAGATGAVPHRAAAVRAGPGRRRRRARAAPAAAAAAARRLRRQRAGGGGPAAQSGVRGAGPRCAPPRRTAPRRAAPRRAAPRRAAPGGRLAGWRAGWLKAPPRPAASAQLPPGQACFGVRRRRRRPVVAVDAPPTLVVLPIQAPWHLSEAARAVSAVSAAAALRVALGHRAPPRFVPCCCTATAAPPPSDATIAHHGGGVGEAAAAGNFEGNRVLLCLPISNIASVEQSTVAPSQQEQPVTDRADDTSTGARCLSISALPITLHADGWRLAADGWRLMALLSSPRRFLVARTAHAPQLRAHAPPSAGLRGRRPSGPRQRRHDRDHAVCSQRAAMCPMGGAAARAHTAAAAQPCHTLTTIS